MKTRRVILAALSASAVAALTWHLLFRRIPVTVVPVVRGTAIDVAYESATVEAYNRGVVKAKVSGTIVELAANEGDLVNEGQVLARIDAPVLRADVSRERSSRYAASQQAEAEGPQVASLSAKADALGAELAVARDEQKRVAHLAESNSVAVSQLQQSTSRVAVLEADLASVEAQKRALRIDLTARLSGAGAQLDSAESRLRDAEVRAPLRGTLLHRLVEVGEVVAQNQLLFRIGDRSKLVGECAVDEADIPRVRVGGRVIASFRAYAGQSFEGTVFQIVPDADREKKTFLVRVRLTSAPPNLRSGLGGEVNIILDQRPNALLIPAEAVSRDSSVWTVKEGHAHQRTIEIGIRETTTVEVLRGLEEGEIVVTRGLEHLGEGARVATTAQAPHAP